MSRAREGTLGSTCAGQERLDALQSYGLLDTGPEPEFDEITRLLSHLCEVPVAVISLVDKDRQWFKSKVGLALRETTLDVSICAHAMLQDELFIVPDLSADSRFKDNVLVRESPFFRFYAGALLRSPEGLALGTLCVLDDKPRVLTEHQKDSLRLLAGHVVTLFEARRRRLVLEVEQKDAQRAIRAREQFLATLSHELRTPLMPITLTCSALLSDAGMNPALRETIEVIQRNVKQQVNLLDELVDFTLLGRGRLELQREKVSIHEILEEVLAWIRAEPEHPEISASLVAHQHIVDGDRARLRQVFWNILRNAVKFTPRSGHIDVSTVDAGTGFISIRVQDTGEGISPEFLDHLHQPFEKGARGPAKKKGGLGLGLTIARGIVDLHGGTLRAASAGALAGATFTVELPAANVEPREEVTSVIQPLPSSVRLRILLVEDQAATAVSLTMLLFRAGHEVLAANSVTAALEIAERQPFDVLISDIGLPDGTGYDLMRSLGGRDRVAGIALSGYSSPEDKKASADAGFACHLVKPADYSDIEQALTRVVGMPVER